MTASPALVREAQDWLDQLDRDLLEDPQYRKSGEEYQRRMEREIRRYHGDYLDAIKVGLANWLRGDDAGKSLFALLLLDRLEAVEYLGELESLYSQLRVGSSRWPQSRLDLVEQVVKHLRDVQEKGSMPGA